MLEDFERKLLRILYNYSSINRKMPSYQELERKTGRDKKGIIFALDVLEKEQYIFWEKPTLESVKIIRTRDPADQPLKYRGDN